MILLMRIHIKLGVGAAKKELIVLAKMFTQLQFQFMNLNLTLLPNPNSKSFSEYNSLSSKLTKTQQSKFSDYSITYKRSKTLAKPQQIEPENLSEETENIRISVEEDEGEEEGLPYSNSSYIGREEEDFDRDPEFAEILGSCFDDPVKAKSKVEERIRKKRSKMVHTKTGSAVPIKITFNKFQFSNSYIWFEFYNAPLPKDITLICDTIRSWHIIGRLGGCNSMNMQLSETPVNTKRPKYDAIQGANVAPTTFYNIGDVEVQDNLARIWVDIGTSEPLLLDVLINAMSSISSDYVGIKQIVFGGTEFDGWKQNLTSDDDCYSSHKI